DVIKRMAKVADISMAEVPPAGAVQLLVRGDTVALPLKGVIDLAAEKARLEKEKGKAEADINRIDAKLGNPDFIARAPEEVVEADREKREEAMARRAKILEALERLRQMEGCDLCRVVAGKPHGGHGTREKLDSGSAP